MFKELIDIFNDEKLNKGSLKLERILLLVIPYFYFVFGLFFYKAPNIHDPMSLNQRAFGASIFLVLFILSFISEWVKKRLQTLINIAVYFAVIHLAYVAYLNSYDYDIAISLIVTIAIANLFFEWNEIILYCNIITSIFIGITLLFIEETIPFRISYFVIYLSIATFSYLISYQKSTMKNKLDIITNQQEMLLSNTDTQIWYLIDYDKYGKVNQAHANFLGVNKKEIENEKLDKFFNDEEAKVCKRKNKKVFKGKKKTKSKEWIRNKNNELRCLSITKIPKVNNKGSVEFVICSANDITEKIEKKEQLKLTQFSIDNAPVGVYWITPEGELDYANNKACRMLNYNKEELVGKKIFDIDPNYNSNQRNQFWENLKRINTKKLETKHKGWRFNPCSGYRQVYKI